MGLSESLCVRCKTPSKTSETPPFPPISYPALAGLIGIGVAIMDTTELATELKRPTWRHSKRPKSLLSKHTRAAMLRPAVNRQPGFRRETRRARQRREKHPRWLAGWPCCWLAGSLLAAWLAVWLAAPAADGWPAGWLLAAWPPDWLAAGLLLLLLLLLACCLRGRSWQARWLRLHLLCKFQFFSIFGYQ